jgi:hypothetical protein
MSSRLNEKNVSDMSFNRLTSVFYSFGWSSWQLQKHEYRAKDLHIKEGWSSLAGVKLYEIKSLEKLWVQLKEAGRIRT